MHECVSGSVDASQSVPLLASDDDVTLHSKDEHQTSSDVTEEETSPNKCVYSLIYLNVHMYMCISEVIHV